MNFKRLHIFAVSLICWLAGFAAAEERAARIIVPFNAGGPADSVIRLIAKPLSETLGRTFVIENKPGATGFIGTQYVAKAPADGLTILAGTKSALVTAPLLNPHAQVDPTKDFIPIDIIVQDEVVLLVSSQLPVNSVTELVALAKSKPAALNYGTSGYGSSYHFDVELFSSMVDIHMTHIPFGGAAPAFQELMAGRIDVQFQAMSQISAHLGSNRFKVLAVAGRQRLPELPEVPTLAESMGIKAFDAAVWTGLFVPQGTPQTEVTTLRRALRDIKKSVAVQQALTNMGLRLVNKEPEAVLSQLSTDLKMWKAMVDSGRVTR